MLPTAQAQANINNPVAAMDEAIAKDIKKTEPSNKATKKCSKKTKLCKGRCIPHKQKCKKP